MMPDSCDLSFEVDLWPFAIDPANASASFNSLFVVLHRWVAKQSPYRLKVYLDTEQIAVDSLFAALTLFGNAFESSDDLTRKEAFRRYCFVVARHAMLNAVRDAKRQKRRADLKVRLEIENPIVLEPAEEPDCSPATCELFGQLENLLSPVMRRIVELRLEGLTNREIASELNIALRSVERIRSRIKEIFIEWRRNHLAEFGNKQQTTNNKQQTTNNKQQTTTQRKRKVIGSDPNDFFQILFFVAVLTIKKFLGKQIAFAWMRLPRFDGVPLPRSRTRQH